MNGKSKMRRSRVVMTAMMGAALLMMGGCGKAAEQQAANLLDGQLTGSEALELAQDIQSALGDSKQDKEETEATVAAEEVRLFPAADGWKDLPPLNNAVQIDDTIYQVGVSMDDFIKQVEASSVTYEYEYNPDKLAGGSTITVYWNNAMIRVSSEKAKNQITFTRGGIPWFTITGTNPDKETQPFSTLIVTKIDVEEAAKEYCRYIDGRSLEDFRALSYSDVKAMGDTIFADCRKGEVGYDSTIQFNYTAELSPWKGEGHYAYENSYIFYSFFVDANTSQLTDASIPSPQIDSIYTEVYDGVEELSDLTREEIEEINEKCIEAMREEKVYEGWDSDFYADAEYQPIGYYFRPYSKPWKYGEMEVQYNSIGFAYEIKKPNGKVYYGYAYYNNLVRTEDGELGSKSGVYVSLKNMGEVYASIADLEQVFACPVDELTPYN